MEMSDTVELKPCPFCGNEARIAVKQDGGWGRVWYVRCSKRNARTDGYPVEWLREKANGNDFLIGRAARLMLHAWEWENNPSPTCGSDYCNID